ncbi:hypothetical protein GRS96_03960 [Rathayibacter sp. VKM Ac-2803]|uniref:hypothetical protein n=1 Tax=unclassified Rathayibacter TaxID=2609250 RepID=UPI00135C4768|nr:MULTISPECIES: hypothetical protein [unclassified Rathayibacter]MWV48433.1 hypothetical protein [Rathayibacter sp. VKM Ac-2803]MWV59075.1 hypothetical protein [Rathayibacter sp. VKM Ac-2754]
MSIERPSEYVPSPMWGSYVTTTAVIPNRVGRYTDAQPARPRVSREHAVATGAVALPST